MSDLLGIIEAAPQCAGKIAVNNFADVITLYESGLMDSCIAIGMATKNGDNFSHIVMFNGFREQQQTGLIRRFNIIFSPEHISGLTIVEAGRSETMLCSHVGILYREHSLRIIRKL